MNRSTDEMTSAASTTAATESLLRFEAVSLHFDETVALDSVSFEMGPGETRVILGAAGSGKTTLLKAAIGLIQPDSGRIYLFGEEITGLKENQLFDIRSKVGVLFQEGGLFDSITIAENVAYPLLNGHTQSVPLDEVETKVREALRFVELEQTMDQFPAELSGGMRRRVGIARAVVSEPPLVLYDSPTAGLDPITATTIMALIAKERDLQDIANLIVTQRYQDGQLMANFRYNRSSGHLESASGSAAGNGGAAGHGSDPTHTVFMVMKEGRVVFEGTQHELEAYQDAYVQEFVPKH
jgi:phospholipid/cholesterol/gamma-HCH transport system ATP-binding protein